IPPAGKARPPPPLSGDEHEKEKPAPGTLTAERRRQIANAIEEDYGSTIPEFSVGTFLRSKSIMKLTGVREFEVNDATPEILKSRLLTVEGKQLSGGIEAASVAYPTDDAALMRGINVGGNGKIQVPKPKFFAMEHVKSTVQASAGRRGLLGCVAPDVITMYQNFQHVLAEKSYALPLTRQTNVTGGFDPATGAWTGDPHSMRFMGGENDDDCGKPGCNAGVLKQFSRWWFGGQGNQQQGQHHDTYSGPPSTGTGSGPLYAA
ncbi:unnamed protein product, partial [Amoebophrya sp. A25]